MEKNIRDLENFPIPEQYQVLETFSSNEATNINKVLRTMLVSKFPLTNPIKVPNCVIKSFPGFGYSFSNSNKTVTLTRGIFIITEVMIQTYENVTLELNNSSSYYDSKPSGSFSNKVIYFAAHYNYEQSEDVTFGIISNIDTYNADKEHYLLILDIIVDGSGGNITNIDDVVWHDGYSDTQESIPFSLKVVDDGWLEPIPDYYVEAANNEEHPFYDPTIIPLKVTKIKLKRGNQYDVNNYTPEDGELVWGENTKRLKIGDGSTKGGIDILEGNVDFLSQQKYYGTDFNGNKGFHNIPHYVDLNSYKFYTESGEIDYLNDYIPNIKFSDSTNKYASVFIPISYDKLQTQDIGLRITYALSGTGPEGADKNIRLGFVTQNFIRNSQLNNHMDKSYIERTLVSTSDNIGKISTIHLAINPSELYWAYLDQDKRNELVSKLSDPSTRQSYRISRIQDYLNWGRKIGFEGIVLTLYRLGERDEDTYPGDFHLIDLYAYPISKGSEYAYLTGSYLNATALPSECLHFSFDEKTTALDIDMPNRCVHFCGFNSSTHGIIAGGSHQIAGVYTNSDKIYRIEFPFKISVAEEVGKLSQPITFSGGCNSSSSGYSMHGTNQLSGSHSYVEKYIFSLESSDASRIIEASTFSGDFKKTISFNSSTHGFAVSKHSVRRMTFSSEGDSLVTTNKSSSYLLGFQGTGFNSSQIGYTVGGLYESNGLSTCYKYQFPFDSGECSLGGNLNYGRFVCGGGNSSIAGYVMSGMSYQISPYKAIEKVIFPFDSGTAVICGNTMFSDTMQGVVIDGTDFVNLFT